MKIYKNAKYGFKRGITVDMSAKFTYKSKKELSYVRLGNEKWFTSVHAKNAKAISVSYDKNSSQVRVNGKKMQIDICTDSVFTIDSLIAVSGTGTNVELKNSKRGIEMTNLTGICDFLSDDLQSKKNSETKLRFLPISKKVRVKNPMSKKLTVTGAIACSNRTAKKVENIHAIPVSANKMVLNFNRVKDAKGYYIYRYDESTSSYKQIGKLKGNKSTLFQDNDVQKNVVYRYKVSSYKGKKGKTKESKKSYEVSAVTDSDTLSNATKVP